MDKIASITIGHNRPNTYLRPQIAVVEIQTEQSVLTQSTWDGSAEFDDDNDGNPA